MEHTLDSLSPALETITSAVIVGWDKGQKYIVGTTSIVFSKNTRSAIANEFIINEVKGNFTDAQWIGNRNTLQGLAIYGKFIKFKKIDKYFNTSNIQTKQVIAYNTQMPLPGFESMEHLFVGWLPDETETRLSGIYLIKPRSSYGNHWRIELCQYLADKSIITKPLTMVHSAPVLETAVPRVKDVALAHRKHERISNG